MKYAIAITGSILAAAMAFSSAAKAATFTLTGGSAYTLPSNFDPSPSVAGLSAGAVVARNATLGLSGPGKVTFSYLGAEAGYSNQLWADGSLLFTNKASGQAPVTLDFGLGALPFSFATANPAQKVANGASSGFYNSIAFFKLSETSVLALFNDSATSDKDYDDMVVRLDVAPIPLPAAAWLLLTGLGGLGIAGRRRAAA